MKQRGIMVHHAQGEGEDWMGPVYSGDWRGLDVTFLGVEEIRGEGGIRSRRISPIGWYVTPWGNMTPALTFKSI